MINSKVEIIKGNEETKGPTGIHRYIFPNDTEDQIDSMIQDALWVAAKKGFDRIYIYDLKESAK